MKIARLIWIASACLTPVFGGYTYDYPNLLNPYNGAQWTSNGSNTVSTNFYTSSASTGAR